MSSFRKKWIFPHRKIIQFPIRNSRGTELLFWKVISIGINYTHFSSIVEMIHPSVILIDSCCCCKIATWIFNFQIKNQNDGTIQQVANKFKIQIPVKLTFYWFIVNSCNQTNEWLHWKVDRDRKEYKTWDALKTQLREWNQKFHLSGGCRGERELLL